MRRVIVWCVVAWAGVVTGGRCAGGEADDLLARARSAQTGAADTDRMDAVLKLRGTLVLDGHRVAFAGEYVARAGDRDRLTLTGISDAGELHVTVISAGGQPKTYVSVGDGTLPYQQYLEAIRALTAVRDMGRAALLHGSADSQLLFAEKVGGRDALGFTFKPPREDATRRYYFDQAGDVLLKVELRADRGKGFREEFVFGGHAEATAGAADVRALRAVEVGADAKAVADFLRQQTADAARAERIKELIARLGHDDFAVRERAMNDLVAVGRPALPSLETAMKSRDPEVARRAEAAAELIRARLASATVCAAVRVLARQRPDGATAVLLDLLAGADAEVGREIGAALAALARGDGKTDTVLEKALEDRDEAKRRAAEALLGKDGGAYLKEPGRRLYPGASRFPAKAELIINSKTVAEVEFLDVQFFNRLDDCAFARP
jgi:hypothetical protein